ncbi:hypothetical protein [Sphingomonas sp. PB4P5]|uniref:hypothetical protein n=1 Tax=Parasphingomonas puruogangriensis TaxID=3096155 RepID=UPI002FCC435B
MAAYIRIGGALRAHKVIKGKRPARSAPHRTYPSAESRRSAQCWNTHDPPNATGTKIIAATAILLPIRPTTASLRKTAGVPHIANAARIGINVNIPTSPPEIRTSAAPVRHATKDAAMEFASNHPQIIDNVHPMPAIVNAARRRSLVIAASESAEGVSRPCRGYVA